MDIDLSQYSFDTIALNIVVAWLIQKAKLSKWPIFSWISAATPKVTILISVVMAALTAAGMGVNWMSEGASHTLTISGITWSSVFMFVWYTIKNLAFQHTAYEIAFKPKKDISAILGGLLQTAPVPASPHP